MEKLPKVIIHNSVSIDGSLTNFEPDMGLHYKIAGDYKPEAHLIGSNTIKTGIEMYGGVTPEKKEDFEKPKRDSSLPVWAIIDTKGTLKGLLHSCRRFEFCSEVIVLIAEETPKDYIQYLQERNYPYHVVGKTRADLKRALELLAEKYRAKTVLTDTGRILGNLLLNQGLVEEVSLLVHPLIVGEKSYAMFSEVDKSIKLKLKKKETFENGCVWLVYDVGK